MPVVHPADLWRESGRYDKIGPEMVRFKDRGDRDMVLAMTHEEVVADLLRDIVPATASSRCLVYHFQTKFRDEPRSRGGLIRVREFVMKDSYSCDRDVAGLDVSYQKHYDAYTRIFERLGLDAIPVGADVGMMGGSLAHEFMVLNDWGEDTLVLCERGGYAANQQIADVGKPEPPRGGADGRPRRSRRPARRPSPTSRRSWRSGRSAPPRRSSSSTGDGRLVTAIVRGDYEVNETKLANAIKAAPCVRRPWRRSARPGWSPATARPVGRARHRRGGGRARRPIAEPGCGRQSAGLPPAQRERGARLHARRHRRHRQRPGGRCLSRVRRAGHPAQRDRGRQHLQARDATSRMPMGATYLGEDGERHPIVMGSYGIGLGRAWPASWRRTTTRRGSPGRRRWRRTPPTS